MWVKWLKKLELIITLRWLDIVLLISLIITITISSNMIGALTGLFPTNYCVGLKSDSVIGQLAEIGHLKSDSCMSQSY